MDTMTIPETSNGQGLGIGRTPAPEDVEHIVLLELLTSAATALDTEPTRARLPLARAVAMIRAELERTSAANPARGLSPWQAKKAVAHIDGQLDHAIRVDDLAGLARLSNSYFSRAFKRTFGRSPQEYILDKRVARAKRLMLTSSASLSEVALACGFSDQAHLTRVFRRSTGDTPGAWRRARLLQDVPLDGIVAAAG